MNIPKLIVPVVLIFLTVAVTVLFVLYLLVVIMH